VQRELYLFKSEHRLNQFLNEFSTDGELPESVLGLGFFAVRDKKELTEPGVDLCVSPVFLKATLYRAMAQDAVLPFSSDPIFLGSAAGLDDKVGGWSMRRKTSEPLDVRSVRRWILSSLHPYFGLSQEGDDKQRLLTCHRELAEAQGISDAVAVLLREMFRRVLNMRASTVLFAPDTQMLEIFFSEMARWRLTQGYFARLRDFLRLPPVDRRELILREMLVWLVEESVNDRVIVLCRSPAEYDQLVLDSRYLLRNIAIPQPIQFRL